MQKEKGFLFQMMLYVINGLGRKKFILYQRNPLIVNKLMK